MPAHTLAAIEVIQKDLKNDRQIPSQHILDFYPIYKFNGSYYIATLAKVNDAFHKEQAIEDGYDVGAVIGNIVSMRIPINALQKNFSCPGIEYIEVAEKIMPELDAALVNTRANLVHKGNGLPQPYTGKNVLIGIVDWGFDYTHPMFYDTLLSGSRILAAWDQEKVIGTPPAGFSHGSVYTTPQELADAKSDTFSILHDYHGTHVAGIAGGSGGGTKYRGTGFGSQLIFSQMRNDVSSSLDAFQWMYQVAQSQGKRLVINNSWGGYRTHPLDGTSLMSQAIDALSDQGVVFVFSAGNNGDINFHIKKTFSQDSIRTRIMGFNYTSDDDLWGQTVTMWGEPGHDFSMQLRILDAQNNLVGQSELFNTATSQAFADTIMVIGADTVFYNVILDAAHPLNDRPQMTLNLKSENQDLKKILYATADTGTVHFWNTRLTIYGGGNWGYGFTAPAAGYNLGDKNYGIGHPGVTNSVITTAAHKTNFLTTGFSSYGPRMDEAIKPDISAPGENIISSFNSYAVENLTPVTTYNFNGRTYEWVRLSGTSMSAPMVTGAVALLLEADPNLSAAEVKQIVIDGARNDQLTGDIGPEGHVRWGYGKLDALNMLQEVLGTSTDGIMAHESFIFPNPVNGEIFVDIPLNGNESYSLFDMNGKLVSNGVFNEKLDIRQVPNGVYTFALETGAEHIISRIVILK